MAFGTPKGRKRLDFSPLRCAECGEPRGSDIPNLAPACAAHPNSYLIRWDNEYLWAGEYIRVDGAEVLRMFQDQPAEAPKYYPGVSKEKVFEVTELFKKWGLMPARKKEWVPGTYNPLFEAKRPVHEATEGES